MIVEDVLDQVVRERVRRRGWITVVSFGYEEELNARQLLGIRSKMIGGRGGLLIRWIKDGFLVKSFNELRLSAIRWRSCKICHSLKKRDCDCNSGVFRGFGGADKRVCSVAEGVGCGGCRVLHGILGLETLSKVP